MSDVPPDVRDKMVLASIEDLGVPYRWGANGPASIPNGMDRDWKYFHAPEGEQWGLDCSGAVLRWYRRGGGVMRDYAARELYARLPHTDKPMRGDLAFYGNGAATHVVMLLTDGGSAIIGANGGYSPLNGETFDQYKHRMHRLGAMVRIEDMRKKGMYYRKDFLGVRTWPWDITRRTP